MSLTRTALRLAAVNALTGTTAAGNRVYDSRIADLDPDQIDGSKPILIVLTDADEGQQRDRNNGGPPWDRTVDLVIELAMVAKDQNGDEYTAFTPETDGELEATLDVLEQQVEEALAFSHSAASSLFRRLCRLVGVRSQRQVSDDAHVKFAARQLTYSCSITRIDRPDLFRTPPDSAPTGLDRLPEPLRTVAKALPSGTAGADIVAGIAAAYAPQTAPPLKGIDATLDTDRIDPNNPTVRADIDLPQ